MNKHDEHISEYLLSIKFNDCSVERYEFVDLIAMYAHLLKLPRLMQASTAWFDIAEINVYKQPEDELALHKRAGDFFSNFLTDLNFTIADQMGIRL